MNLGGYLRSFLAIINNYLVVFTARDQRVTGGWEVDVVDPICVFFKYFRHSKTSHYRLRQPHFCL